MASNKGYFPRPLTSPSQTSFLSANDSRLSSSPRFYDREHGDISRTSLASDISATSSVGPGSINTAPRSFVTQTRGGRVIESVSDKFSLSADPAVWGVSNLPEPDDELHNVDRKSAINARGNIFTCRGMANLGCLLFLTLAIFALFAGYPILSFFLSGRLSTLGGFNLGGINATGQIPSMAGNWGLIDVETPESALYIKSFNDDGAEYQLVFSDEFNTEGRSFYPGDDPYWEAVDLHYWQTGNLEWYDPAAVTTKDGALQITLSEMQTHNLSYQGGMLMTWNKFCFTGGLILSSVTLPGLANIHGLWPAVWTMGNLGRAGYGASLEGMWPYTYDACDVGTAPNQTHNGLPLAATVNGDPYNGDVLSYLQGQRLSRCTCPGESHPGPVHKDGSYVGRAAPEIDIFEAQVRSGEGQVSQSGQWAPFNEGYNWFNTSDNMIIYNDQLTAWNNYQGGAFQQATSCSTTTDQNCYQYGGTGCFSTYGFEYKPGYDGAYITWISDGKASWTLNAAGMAADPKVEISARPIPQEPLYIIANLGMSPGFGAIDFAHITFPAIMSIDWIRVYQPKNKINIGCDPKGFPTQAYINQYAEAYNNPLLTTWTDDYKQPFPKNSFMGEC
ncbi:beta-glucan synthesis-associated [Mycena floridula]|nr:beta-glucan synthesis-associated [Mycena floridula]